MRYLGPTQTPLLVILSMCMQAIGFAQSTYPQDDISEREAIIAQWGRQASLQSALEIMVIVFGAAITVVQDSKKAGVNLPPS